MRQIKFRVWDKSKNNWADSEPYFHSCIGDFSVNSEKYVYQQFTGFYDQNTKEIYEGDIVRAICHERTCANGDILKSHDDIIEVKMIPDTNLSSRYCKDGDYFEYTNIDIIGNVLQNPELLK